MKKIAQLIQLQELLERCGLRYYSIVPRSLYSFEDYETTVVFLLPYYMAGEGNLSVYARGEDYHKVAREQLEAVCTELDWESAYFCDISPVDEVALAATAGLGVIGRNRLLLTEQFGSYVFLCELFIKHALTDQIVFSSSVSVCTRSTCFQCDLCVKSCPSGALANGFKKEKCLSYLSQKRGALTVEEETLLRKNKIVWGCDICQDVCPMEKNTQEGNDFFKKNLIYQLDALEIKTLSDRSFRKKYHDRAFSFRGVSPLKRNFGLKDQS